MPDSNPYAAPKARVSDAVELPAAAIDDLDVSATWKTRFRLIQAAGGPAMPHIKSLSFGDRMRVMFNVVAFLFGPLYYVAKGLWRKAISFFVIAVVAVMLLSFLLGVLGIESVGRGLGYGVAAVFASRANIDYYKRVVLNDNGWW